MRYKSRTLAIALGTLAVACHITTLISVLAFLLGHYIRKPKLFLWGWLGCFVVSLVAGGSVQALIGQYFENSEETRIAGYVLSESDQGYRVGFRWDFVLYSMVGILVPLFYRIYYRVRDKLYDTLFCAYLAANGFWLLVIRIPYSDRVAYLSWFLFPLLLLTPLVRWREIPAKGQKVALCLFAQAAFSVFMAIYQSLKISS